MACVGNGTSGNSGRSFESLHIFNFPIVPCRLSFPYAFSFLQDEFFLDKEGGGYFNTPGEDPSVLLRVKEDHDGAEPSGNLVSAVNLVRLASLVSENKADDYKRKAEHLLVCISYS